MTVSPLPLPPVAPAPPPAPRTAPKAVPWTEESLSSLVAAVRGGADVEDLRRPFGRGPASLLTRLRLFLPLEERNCPVDRIVPRLREVLADEAYDWRQAMLLTPPPTPIVRPEYKGLAGLSRAQLGHVAVAVLSDRWANASFAVDVRAEVERRGDEQSIRNALVLRLIERGIPRDDAEESVTTLWEARPVTDSWYRYPY